MMNKKGFTLIELLATIAILSLLMLLAVPNVMSTIDKNKKDTYIEDAKKMITLAEYEVRSNTSIELPEEGNCIVIPLGNLDLSDFNEGPEGGDYDLNKSYVMIGRKGSSYEYYAAIVENFDCDTEEANASCSTRGVPLSSRNDLNKENARNTVVSNDELDIKVPTIGDNLAGYIVSKVIDS